MSSPYSIETDARTHSLHIVMRGYWDQTIFDSFAQDYERTMRRMHALGGLRTALVDGREFSVQAKAISEQFGTLIARNKPYLAKRTASVVATRLNKLQAERAGGELAARYFTDMDEAQAWLATFADGAVSSDAG
jgi:hypothetical protein